jgi:hypothetical protein
MSSNVKTASTGKKKGGGFLARQAKAKTDKNQVTEEELLQRDSISPDDVLKLHKISESKDQFWIVCAHFLILV